MQTFLPYPDFFSSLAALDTKRLGKQRVEARQILNTLSGRKKGWRNHPAVKMWRGYEPALRLYLSMAITEWRRRGYRNTMRHPKLGGTIFPPWFGDEAFHRAHQSNLIRKDPKFYGPKFPGVPDNLPYIWPVE
jgi:hypothetical protein